MPLSPQIPKLARNFDVLFDAERAPQTTEGAASAWAAAYVDWALVGGVVAAPGRESIFASALTKAFNPELAGGGPKLFIDALSVFWMGMPIPQQAGVVAAFVPTGSVNSPQPDDATPKQQADGLANVIAGFTLSAVKVQSPPGTGPLVPLA